MRKMSVTQPAARIGWLTSLRLNPVIWRLGNRYGRSYWRLPRMLRRSIHWETSVHRLKGAKTWCFGDPESAESLSLRNIERPTLGQRLVARPGLSPAPAISVLRSAWLAGRYASPVTLRGKLIPSAFRDEPRMLGYESNSELISWLAGRGWKAIQAAVWNQVWPMVNRLQTNYFHWLIEWCGRLELIERYRECTGHDPQLLIPEEGPRFIRESLQLLGFGADRWIEWPAESHPVFVSDLLLPSFRGNAVAPSAAAMQWLRGRFLAAAGARDEAAEEIVYLSRPTGWRSVVNDQEVADWFRSEGYEVIVPHELSLREQILKFSRCRLIVSLHGAGLTNLIFAPHAGILELTGGYGDGLYFWMAGRLKAPYASLDCQPMGDDVRVDLPALARAVEAFKKKGEDQLVAR